MSGSNPYSDSDIVEFARRRYGDHFVTQPLVTFAQGGRFAKHVRGSLTREMLREEW